MSAKQTQNEQVLAHLQRGESITPLQALGVYGIFRLASRIDEIRKDLRLAGSKHVIVTEMVADPKGKRYARYRMIAPGRALVDGKAVGAAHVAG